MTLNLETITWRGVTRYVCPTCSFDAQTEQAVVKHWLEMHKPPEAVLPAPTLFDADGQKIDRRIYAPGLDLPDLLAGLARGESDSEELHHVRNRDDSSDREQHSNPD